jgi:hypothetical protein
LTRLRADLHTDLTTRHRAVTPAIRPLRWHRTATRTDKPRADTHTDRQASYSTALRTDKLRTVLLCEPTVLVLIYLRYRLRTDILLLLWFNLRSHHTAGWHRTAVLPEPALLLPYVTDKHYSDTPWTDKLCIALPCEPIRHRADTPAIQP